MYKNIVPFLKMIIPQTQAHTHTHTQTLHGLLYLSPPPVQNQRILCQCTILSALQASFLA